MKIECKIKSIRLTVNLILGEALSETLVEIEHELVSLDLLVLLTGERRGLCGGTRVNSGVAHVAVLLPHERLLLDGTHRQVLRALLIVAVRHCNSNQDNLRN